LRLWDPAAGRPIGKPLSGHEDSVWDLAFPTDGRLLASGGWDGKIRLWRFPQTLLFTDQVKNRALVRRSMRPWLFS